MEFVASGAGHAGNLGGEALQDVKFGIFAVVGFCLGVTTWQMDLTSLYLLKVSDVCYHSLKVSG